MRHLILTVLFLFGVLTSVPASAATVDYSTDLGLLPVGSTGVLTTLNFIGQKGNIDLSGLIPSDSKITFTFTYTPAPGHSRTLLAASDLSSYGSYDYYTGRRHHRTEYYGEAGSDANAHQPAGDSWSWGNKYHHGHETDTAAFVLAAANFPSSDVGVATVINDAASKAYFDVTLDIFRHLYGTLTVSYSVSAVPLPASFPLFVLALAAMIALGYRQKMRQKMQA